VHAGRAPASPETIRHAGVLAAWGILLTPALGAVLMSASTVIVAINAQFRKRVVL
jgi:P-type Cu2+ transporter